MAEHILLTKFSVRIAGFGCSNPLEPKRLWHRLGLLESITAPCIRAQSRQAFTWLIKVDPELRADIRARLERALDGIPSAQILEHEPGSNDQSLAFASAYLQGASSHASVTVLDDDDGLHRELLGGLQDQIMQRESAGTLPAVSFVSCKDARQWDVCGTADAPLGRMSAWTNKDVLGAAIPPSAGHTICFHKDLLGLPLLCAHHDLIFAACRGDEARLVRHPRRLYRLAVFQKLLRDAARIAEPGWDGRLIRSQHYADHQTPGLQAVMAFQAGAFSG